MEMLAPAAGCTTILLVHIFFRLLCFVPASESSSSVHE